MIINKKGGMEMSINLIIIIIIALTVLGLVLGFVVSKFNEADTQFDIGEKLAEADYNTPITFSGGNLNLQPNKATGKTISIYNYAQASINLGSATPDVLTIKCLPTAGIVTISNTELLDYEITSGTTDTTQVTLTATGPKGDYACKAIIMNNAGDAKLLGSDVKLVIK